MKLWRTYSYESIRFRAATGFLWAIVSAMNAAPLRAQINNWNDFERWCRAQGGTPVRATRDHGLQCLPSSSGNDSAAVRAAEAAAAAAAAERKRKADEADRQGLEAANRGDWTAAANNFMKALEFLPNSPEILAHLHEAKNALAQIQANAQSEVRLRDLQQRIDDSVASAKLTTLRERAENDIATRQLTAITGTTALAWEAGHPERRVWSDELRQAIRGQIASLDQASDMDEFAPGYKGLSTDERVDVWASLFVAIARYESNYNPNDIYHEKSVPGHPSPIDSVGLFQISYENQSDYPLEPLDRGAKSLEDPLVNVRCAVTIMARLVRQNRVLAAGSRRSARGGARYWSTLWPSKNLSDIRQIVRQRSLQQQLFRRPQM